MDENKVHGQKILIRILSIAVILLLGVIIILFVRGRTVENITVGETAENQESAPAANAPQTASSTTQVVTSTPAQAATSSVKSAYFAYPYPVSWTEDEVNFSLMGVTLGERMVGNLPVFNASSGAYRKADEVVDALTLYLKISNPTNDYKDVGLTIRRLLNEEGDMTPPDTLQFQFSTSGGAQLGPQESYDNQEVVFVVSEDDTQFTLTTGGNSNIFFFVTVEDDGTLKVEKAPTSENG